MLQKLRRVLAPSQAHRRRKERFVAQCRDRLAAEGYDRLFVEEDGSALSPDFDDLATLVDLVHETRPSLVLEYGSGYSTYVMAETLRRSGKGRLVSVELDPRWREVTLSRLQPEHRAVAEVISPQPQILFYNAKLPSSNRWFRRQTDQVSMGVVTIAFPELHDLKPDLIFLDGPGKGQVSNFVDFEGRDLPTIVSDPLLQKRPSVICVDGRDSQSTFLANNLALPFDVKVLQRQRFTIFRPI